MGNFDSIRSDRLRREKKENEEFISSREKKEQERLEQEKIAQQTSEMWLHYGDMVTMVFNDFLEALYPGKKVTANEVSQWRRQPGMHNLPMKYGVYHEWFHFKKEIWAFWFCAQTLLFVTINPESLSLYNRDIKYTEVFRTNYSNEEIVKGLNSFYKNHIAEI